jgi:Na+-transporting NADH:ubiquinone oxidoreductase subunit C
MHSNKYILGFTVFMCSIISFLLAGTSILLKDKQMYNKKIDMQKNILTAAGIKITDNNKIESIYKKLVTPLKISAQGEILPNSSIQNGHEIFRIKNANTLKIFAYVYPVIGQGLWSTLYGYLSVTPSGNKIIGITFYKHGETPGLGAEIEKIWFRNNFIDKELYKNGTFRGITVAKGQAKNEISYKDNKNHIVDGISGATITSKGVEKMLSKEPLKYHKFFINKINI